MWFSKVTRLGALCDTTTSFDDEPCDRQKEGSCPRAVESDRVRNTLGEREKMYTSVFSVTNLISFVNL
jgi:hypothetical protein